MADFQGTTGNDTYAGTGAADSIFDGGGGNDSLAGAGGDDVVVVTNGTDTVDGGSGSDRLVLSYTTYVPSMSLTGSLAAGYSGFINGYSSNDITYSGIEHFTLTYAGAGSVTFLTGDGDDAISSGSGADVLQTGLGADTIDAGAGLDYWGANLSSLTQGVAIDLRAASTFAGASLVNAEGFRNLTTGSGADTLTGTTETMADSVAAGDGDDLVRLFGKATDTVDGGAGADRLAVHFGATTSAVTLSALTGDFASGYGGLIDDTSSDNVYFSGIEHFTISHVSGGALNVLTGAGDDVISGGSGNDSFRTGAGIDQVDGNDGLDRWGADMSGAEADIVIDLNATSSFLGIGSAVDIEGFATLLTGAGDDRLTGTAADLTDVVESGGGDDQITLFGRGLDRVDGGDGSDLLRVHFSAPVTAVTMNNFAGDMASGYSGVLDGTSSNNVDFSGVERFHLTHASTGTFNVTTGDGDDTLGGGEGNDILNSRGGGAVIDGGAGIDVWGGTYATATDDILIDLNAASTFLGDSSVVNVEGFSTLSTGSGSDRITGTAAAVNDSIVTNEGDDLITLFGRGNDFVDMGGGDDRLVLTYAVAVTLSSVSGDLGLGYGGVFDGTSSDNVTFSGVEHFTLTQTAAAVANLRTGDGRDSLTGGSANDSLRAAGGDDTLEGGDGNDSLDGGDGGDTASYAGASAGVDVDLAQAGTQNTAGAGSDILVGFENLRGSGFNDTLDGTTGANRIEGGAGDDYITALDGADTVSGGLGNDTLVGALGVDRIDYVDAVAGVSVDLSLDILTAQNTGGAGIDRLSGFEAALGSAFSDSISGSAEANTLEGGAGADTLRGMGSADTLRGGEGDDRLDGGAGNDRLQGDSGTDLADYSSAGAAVVLNVSVTGAQSTGGGGSDTLVSIEGAIGSSFDDSLAGTTENNRFDGGQGLDTLRAGAGNDTLNGGDGADLLEAGTGADVIDGGLGVDTLDYSAGAPVRIDLGVLAIQNTQGAGFDSIRNVENVIGTNGADTLIGSNGDNSLTGSGGADSLEGTGGADTLDGGSGNDQLLGGNGVDLVLAGFGSDAMSGGSGNDTVDYSALGAGTFLDLRVTGLQNTRSAGNDSLIGFETVLTGRGDDRVSGSGVANYIYADDGADTLNGVGGADTLEGGLGADSLNGGVDDDNLYGQGGADILRGGFGADRFHFSNPSHSGLGVGARDVIKDFRTGDGDTIVLFDMGHFTYIGAAAFSGSGGDEVRVIADGAAQIVQLDADGDGDADSEIFIANGGLTGGAADFEL